MRKLVHLPGVLTTRPWMEETAAIQMIHALQTLEANVTMILNALVYPGIQSTRNKS